MVRKVLTGLPFEQEQVLQTTGERELWAEGTRGAKDLGKACAWNVVTGWRTVGGAIQEVTGGSRGWGLGATVRAPVATPTNPNSWKALEDFV